MYVRFWDMNSGGRQKEKWDKIIIETKTNDNDLAEKEAKIIFYNRFGHNPDRVTCTCCGSDYSINSHESLKQITGHWRNCKTLKAPINPKTSKRNYNDPVYKKGLYIDDEDIIPEGYEVESSYSNPAIPLEKYLKQEGVLFVPKSEVKPEERIGDVPMEGYIWH